MQGLMLYRLEWTPIVSDASWEKERSMLYLNWFNAVSALCSSDDVTRQISEETRQGLYFLGNMLMPQETHIIRLGTGTPKVFTKKDKFLGPRRDLLAENFYLPGTGVVVEDEISAIGFVDMANGERGVRQPKLFIYIEDKRSSQKTRPMKTLADVIYAAMFELSYPKDGIFTVWGVIDDVDNLNIEGKQVALQVIPWGMAFFNSTQVFESHHSDWFNQHLKRESMPAGQEESSKLYKLMAAYADILGQNLQQGLLQVAYHNAMTEAK